MLVAESIGRTANCSLCLWQAIQVCKSGPSRSDTMYVGYTRGHLHERVEGHTGKSSLIYKHYNPQHNSEMPECFIE